MPTFGEVYRDVCQNNYNYQFSHIRQHLDGSYIGALTDEQARIELVWNPRPYAREMVCARGIILKDSVELFAATTGEDIGMESEHLVIGSNAIISGTYDPETIVKILTDGEFGLPLTPFQAPPSSRREITIG